MYKTIRNLTVLGVGLSVSGVVGWLLFKETQRDRQPSAVRVRSQVRPPEPQEPAEIRLPMESLDAEPEPPALLPAEGDDLTRIVDIGPRFAEALQKIGITSYKQLAAQTPADLAERLSDHVVVRAQRIRDKDWIGQAKRLARES